MFRANPEEYIVPMTLQLFDRKCSKTQRGFRSVSTRISVRKVNDCLEVENNLQPKMLATIRRKTGLKNITQQFAFFSEKPIKIITSDERYMVRVPILKSVEK